MFLRRPGPRPCILAASAALGLLSTVPSAHAAGSGPTAEGEPVQELFLGEVAYSQRQFELQVTNRVSFERRGGRDSFATAALVELGLTDRLEVQAAMPLVSAPADGAGRIVGVGSIEAGVVYGLLQEAEGALAAGVELGSPAVTQGAGEDTYELTLPVAACMRAGRVQLTLTIVPRVEWLASGGARPGTSLILGAFAELGPVLPIVELGLALDDEGAAAIAAPGVLWHPRHPSSEVELGLSIPVALAPAGAAGVLAVATWEIELVEEDAGGERRRPSP